MKRIAFFTGSFDPPTNGHLEILTQAAKLCDQLFVAVGIHPSKAPLFNAQERCDMLEEMGKSIPHCTIKAITYDDLAVSAAKRVDASIIIRGLRDGTDLDYEMQIAGMNSLLEPSLQTVFLPASPAVRHITATLVRQIALMKGDVSHFVPPLVASALLNKLKG